MKQAEFFQKLAETTNQSQKDTKAWVEAFFALITKTIKSGDEVAFPEMGKFFVKKVPAKPKREGRNPMTGATVMLPAKPASAKPAFRPSKKLKEAILGGKK